MEDNSVALTAVRNHQGTPGVRTSQPRSLLSPTVTILNTCHNIQVKKCFNSSKHLLFFVYLRQAAAITTAVPLYGKRLWCNTLFHVAFWCFFYKVTWIKSWIGFSAVETECWVWWVCSFWLKEKCEEYCSLSVHSETFSAGPHYWSVKSFPLISSNLDLSSISNSPLSC